MKKLVVMAAVVVAAVVANAASFKWTASNIYGSDLTTKYTGTISLMAYLSTGSGDDAIVATTFTPTTAGAVSKTFSDDSLVGGSTYKFFMVIEDGGKTFTSTEKTVAAQATSTQNIAFGSMASATQNASNWASSGGGEPVPEPTSGLLMLLGAAGLALRRKRA